MGPGRRAVPDRVAAFREDIAASPEARARLLDGWSAPDLGGRDRFLLTGLGSSRFAALVVAAALRARGGTAWVEHAGGTTPTHASDDLVTIALDTLIDQRRWPALQGPHNAQNAQAAIAVARALGIDAAAIEAGLASYVSLPHRMQHVATRHGVAFVNDSKATNPESTAPALAAFPRVHWIVGGKRKGDDLDACAAHLDHVVAAYTIGEAAPLFFDLLKDKVPVVEQSGTLEAAVAHAAAAARPGDTVLLSPACASFDQFRDYEARGDAFRAAVEALA